MKYIHFNFFILLAFFTSCKNDKKLNEQNVQIRISSTIDPYIPDTIKMYEGVPSEILKGAIFKKNITKIELYNFSDIVNKDTFKFEIPKGKIEYSNSKITIINSKGKTLYSVVFPTNFIANGYELTPNIPDSLDSVQARLYNQKFERKLTKKFYEDYYLNKINIFLKDVVNEANKDDYIFHSQNIRNKQVKNEILKYKKIFCVSFPINEGEEGTTYIGYSKRKKLAYVFSETD
jgi:hypothetical protein